MLVRQESPPSTSYSGNSNAPSLLMLQNPKLQSAGTGDFLRSIRRFGHKFSVRSSNLVCMIRIRISYPRLPGSWCIKATAESFSTHPLSSRVRFHGPGPNRNRSKLDVLLLLVQFQESGFCGDGTGCVNRRPIWSDVWTGLQPVPCITNITLVNDKVLNTTNHTFTGFM